MAIMGKCAAYSGVRIAKFRTRLLVCMIRSRGAGACEHLRISKPNWRL